MEFVAFIIMVIWLVATTVKIKGIGFTVFSSLPLSFSRKNFFLYFGRIPLYNLRV
jgi:hypothetical protein